MILYDITRSSNQVEFLYCAGASTLDDNGQYVRIVYIKTYPVSEGCPAENLNTLKEWEVKVSASADQNVTGPETLMFHQASIALAIAAHFEKNHQALVLG